MRAISRSARRLADSTASAHAPRNDDVHPAAASATNARQPPKAEISRAPSISAASTIKPLTPRPSARRTVPIDSGGGIAATNFPNAAADSAQISSSIDDPVARAQRAACRVLAAWCRAHRACSPARSRPVSSSRPPSAFNSPFSAMPERCAPTTAMAISSPLGPVGNAASGGCGRLRGAHRQLGVGMEDAADAGELRVLAGRRQQRDAERNVVGPHRRRQRQAAEVEQIDEIGVGAEPGVEFDRIGQHLRGRIHRRRGRQHQRVDVGEGALGDRAQRPAAGTARQRCRRR